VYSFSREKQNGDPKHSIKNHTTKSVFLCTRQLFKVSSQADLKDGKACAGRHKTGISVTIRTTNRFGGVCQAANDRLLLRR
jgi:hypothetical protein